MSKVFDCGEFSIAGKTETACNSCLENGCNWCWLETSDVELIRNTVNTTITTKNDNGYCYALGTPQQAVCENYNGDEIDQTDYNQWRDEACITDEARREKRMVELIVFLINIAIFGGIIWCVYRRWKITQDMRQTLMIHPHRHGAHVVGPNNVVQVAEATVTAGPRVVHVQPMDDNYDANYTTVSTNDNDRGSSRVFGTEGTANVSSNSSPALSSFGNYGGRTGHRLSVASPENYSRNNSNSSGSSNGDSGVEMTSPAVATDNIRGGGGGPIATTGGPIGGSLVPPPGVITATAIAVTPRGTPI